jgi:hypothetical protein
MGEHEPFGERGWTSFFTRKEKIRFWVKLFEPERKRSFEEIRRAINNKQ